METKVEFIVGKQTKNNWAGVFGYKPDNKMIFEHLGEMFAVTKLSTDSENASLESIAGLLLDYLQEKYFDKENEQIDSLIRLEDAVWGMRSHLESILSREEDISNKGLDLEMAVVVVVKDVMYCIVIGESKIYIKRDSSFVDVASVLIDANMMGFLKSGSLQLDSNDRIILATSKSVEDGTTLLEQTLESLDITKLGVLKEEIGVGILAIVGNNLEWKIQADEEVVDSVSIEPVENNDEEESFIKDSQIETFFNEGISGDKSDLADSEDSIIPASTIMPQNVPLPSLKNESTFKSLFNKSKEKLQKNYSVAKNKFKSDGDVYQSSEPTDGEPIRYSTIVENNAEFNSDDSNKDSTSIVTSLKNFIQKVITTLQKFWHNNLKKHFTNNKTYATILRNIANRIREIIEKLVDLFKREIIGVGGNRRDMYMRKERTKRNRRIFVIVVLVLGIALFLLIRNAKNQKEFNEQVEARKNQINQIDSRVNGLAPQVQEASTQGEDKKNLIISELDKATSDIDQLKKDPFVNKNTEVFSQEIARLNSLLTKIQNNKDSVLLITPLTEAPIVSDIGKVYPDASLTDIEYSNGNIYVTDSAQGFIYKFNAGELDVRAESFITGLSSPRLLIRNVNGEVIFYDSDPSSAIGKISESTPGTVTRYPGLTEANIGSVKEVGLYTGNDALYEIHQNHQQIFKRTKVGEEYEGGGVLFTPDAETNWRSDPDFGSAIDISVPYEIYALIQGKGLKRYLAGEDNTLGYESFVNFTQNDYNSLQSATCIDARGNFLVVGDSTNKRVMLFEIEPEGEKRIRFVKQFVYRGDDKVFNQINEVVLDEVNRKIFVLDGAKVIRLDM
jgi:hypothetical protein